MIRSMINNWVVLEHHNLSDAFEDEARRYDGARQCQVVVVTPLSTFRLDEYLLVAIQS